MQDEDAPRVASRLRSKAAQLRGRNGSRLYAILLEHAASDAESDGPTLEVLRPYTGDPPGSALALRFLSAVHRLVLEGEAPELARHYPSAGGDAGPRGAWPPFRAVLAVRSRRLREMIARPCQTNDAGRCAALLPGFLAVASEQPLPLRILELGASAGLNLNWDRFRYEAGSWSWGPEDARVRFAGGFEGRPARDGRIDVAERHGCDSAPLDPTDPDTRLALRSSVWADHLDRLELLDGALEVALAHPPVVDRAGAEDWLTTRLETRTEGAATVVFHSILWQYLDDRQRERLRATLDVAGENASAEAPLAWLRMEPAGERASVTLTNWPGALERVVARSGYHGRPVSIEAFSRPSG